MSDVTLLFINEIDFIIFSVFSVPLPINGQARRGSMSMESTACDSVLLSDCDHLLKVYTLAVPYSASIGGLMIMTRGLPNMIMMNLADRWANILLNNLHSNSNTSRV